MKNLNLKIEKGIAILEFDQPDSRVNVLNTETMTELAGAIDELAAKPKDALKALIITSRKNGIFIAGADIKEIEHITSPKEAKDKSDKGKQVLERLKKLDLLTVAAINGACLGGGLELALACKYRVATFSEKVKIGLPEVKLGIIPGFGGTIRLPGTIGLMKALNMILAGSVISAKAALRCGLVDRLFPDTRLLDETIDFVNNRLEGKQGTGKKRKKSPGQALLEDTPFGRAVLFSQARKNVLKKTKGFYPAPLKAIEVIRHTLGLESEAGFQEESKVFSELAVTDISKNLIKVFYLIEEFKKYPWVEDGSVQPARVSKCGILGAGVMGGGIAQLVSFRDILVRVKDINYEALGKALKTAYGLFKYAVKKRKLKKHEADFKFGLISPTVKYDGFQNTDMVIEAVVENLDIKQKVFKEVSAVVSKNTIIASNTSSLPIMDISKTMSIPERAVGLHFFNPVHRMPLVEVIRSEKTSGQTLATTIAFARRLGKTVIVVKDVPGFLINRILLSYLNEAGFLLEEGMRMEHIDKMVRAFGMPMGPVELIDEVGIDVGYKVAKVLEESYGARMKVSSVLMKVKEKGLLGKKSKRGFYIHKGKRRMPNPDIYEIIGFSGKSDISDEKALKRMLYIMINEASLCLEEKVVASPGAIDIGMIMGTGFPPFRAGLLRYADSVGINNIVSDLKLFEEELRSERFKPCGYLIKLAEKKKGFYK
ncbi:MAG: 3-hydroxyacyl-CoA dehydrogenase NAD-binding domain-containing protein [Candidatus Omnitrophota bacterium]